MTERRALLLPGNDLAGSFYAPLCTLLEEGGLPTTAHTLPAFLGQGGPCSWEDLLAQVEPLLAPVLIGHSLGGLLAFLAAARAPERVEQLVLLEPALAPTAGFARKAARRYQRDVVQGDRERFVNWTGAFRRVHRPDRYPGWAIEEYLHNRRQGDPAVVAGLLEGLPDLYPLPFKELTMPVRILRGAHSGWRANFGVWLLARRLPRSQARVIPEAGHWLVNEADEAVAQAILAA